MKFTPLFIVVFLFTAASGLCEDATGEVSVWRMLTDSKYRAARAKQNLDASRRLLPIYGRLAACDRAEQIVSAPLEWQDNARRLAEIPVVLHTCGLEHTQDFKEFEVSATALIEFSAQLQSSTREEVSRQLASERQSATHTINAEAAIDPKLFIKYAGVLDSEQKATAELSTIEKRNFSALTPEQAATFRKLYAQLLKDYAVVALRVPTMTEMTDRTPMLVP